MYNIFIGVLFYLIHDARAQQECYKPPGKIGSCILINECNPMVEYLNSAGQNTSSPQYIEAMELLRISICGYEGIKLKVCCVYPDPPDVSRHQNLILLDHTTCGKFSSDKIFGGHKTSVFEYPWMALIAYQIANSRDLQFRCGGTIINKRYILTAAHCVAALPSNFIPRGVRVGEHNLNTLQDCDNFSAVANDNGQLDCAEGFQDLEIYSITFHPHFSTVTLHNDIGLVRLKTDINFTPENVRPICLPIGSAARLFGNKGIVTGWGSTEVGPQSPELLQVEIPIVPLAQCSAKYSQQNIIYKQMCAGGKSGSDSCSGDSGGPLQNPGNYFNSSRFIQYGIVSYGRKLCGREGFPGIYTSVPYYMDWILNNMRI